MYSTAEEVQTPPGIRTRKIYIAKCRLISGADHTYMYVCTCYKEEKTEHLKKKLTSATIEEQTLNLEELDIERKKKVKKTWRKRKRKQRREHIATIHTNFTLLVCSPHKLKFPGGRLSTYTYDARSSFPIETSIEEDEEVCLYWCDCNSSCE